MYVIRQNLYNIFVPKNLPKMRDELSDSRTGAVAANKLIAENWFAAFNEYNLEKLLSLYDENAVHFSPKLKVRHPETNGWVRGKAALRSWWKDAFERFPQLHYEVTSLTPNNDRIFMEYVRQVPGEPDLLIAEVLEVSNGKIIGSRVYHENSFTYEDPGMAPLHWEWWVGTKLGLLDHPLFFVAIFATNNLL